MRREISSRRRWNSWFEKKSASLTVFWLFAEREILGAFQRQTVGELRAIGPAGGEDAFPVDRVRRYLMVEKAFDETGVVDLQPLGGKWRAAAAIVPGVVEPIRIHDQKSVFVRQLVEFVVGILAHTRGIAAGRMQDEQ